MCYIGVLLPLGVGQATCVLVATAIGEHNAPRARRIMKLGYALTAL
jgi:Na+-driven multidrug efflux pump